MGSREQDADLIRSGLVTRYHTTPELCVRQQSTAEHAWRVAAIIKLFHPGPVSAALLNEALWHDAHETFVGDTPGPTKRRHPFEFSALKCLEIEYRAQLDVPIPTDLTANDLDWLKFADRAEAVNYCATFAPALMRRSDWSGERGYVRLMGERLGISGTDLDQILGVDA